MSERKETALTTQNKHQEQTVNADTYDSNSPKGILLVEDDDDMDLRVREIIGETLERHGHTTIRAALRFYVNKALRNKS